VDLTLPRAYYGSMPEATRKMLRCEVVDALPAEKGETYVHFKF